ncbi:hypothetical protein HAX54_015143, partial [Datura stramonium]|nr:hypothetical protein [Datura stramonium]
IDEGRLAIEFSVICDTIHRLGLGNIFVEPEECNLTLVREFYANRNTTYGKSTKVKLRGLWFVLLG